jgi:hypothetical protein
MRKERIMSSLLAGVLVAGLVTSGASAAGTTATSASSTGTGKVYSPTDIVDVIVPTSLKIAFNPLKINITANETTGLTGATQVLSGTYAIQNRSTIPVDIAAAFTVTGNANANVASAADVATYDAQTDPTKVTMAQFSLDLVTTAKGAAQTLSGTVDATTGTDKMRSVDAASGVKMSKASTKTIPLTNVAKAAAGNGGVTVNFSLAAGPYTATYDATADTVSYTAPANATYDTVAFNFTGTTTTNAAKWAAVSVAPTVTAKYTLTESTTAAYQSKYFDPYSKDVIIEKADVTVASSAAGEYALTTVPAFAKNKDTGDIDYDLNKVTVLSLKQGSVKGTAMTYTAAGISVDTSTDVTKLKISKVDTLEVGFYQFTVGSNIFTVQVK